MKIQKFTAAQLLSMELPKKGDLPSATEAVRSSAVLTMPGKEDSQFGIWEATEGTFTREVVAGEIMLILSGQAVFISDSGERWEMSAGDTLVFPPNSRGNWEILKATRKLYVLL